MIVRIIFLGEGHRLKARGEKYKGDLRGHHLQKAFGQVLTFSRL